MKYGYGWHIYHLKNGDRNISRVPAGGNGGQIVMVISRFGYGRRV